MKIKALVLFLTLAGLLPLAARAQVSYVVSENTVYVTATNSAYKPSGNIVIASSYSGYPVTSIGEWAFEDCYDITSITIPNSVTNIGQWAFEGCYNMTKIIIPIGITYIGEGAFNDCFNLTNITIPNGITTIGDYEFEDCHSLSSITIPRNVASIGEWAFLGCYGLTNITFLGNAPFFTSDIFDYSATVYYYYGTSGWDTTYDGLPTVMLGAPAPQIGADGSVGVQTGNFSFSITGITNQTVVVEGSTNLVDWQSVWTNTLSGASATFTDLQWTNYPARYYRAR